MCETFVGEVSFEFEKKLLWLPSHFLTANSQCFVCVASQKNLGALMAFH